MENDLVIEYSSTATSLAPSAWRMEGDHALLAGEVDHPLEEPEVDGGGGGVVREREHDHARLRPGVLVALDQDVEEVLLAAAEGHLAEVGPGEEGRVDVDGVRRRWHQRGVAGLEEGPHEVAEALLGPDGVDDLALGVELDVPLAGVEVGHGLPQLGDAPAGAVAVVAGVPGRLGQLVDGHLRRGQVGVAEGQVDHVGAGPAGLLLQPVDDAERVRRQVVDAPELHGSRLRQASHRG
jgi:hypothetical protein